MSLSNVPALVDTIASQPGNDDPMALWPSLLTCAFAAANLPSAVSIVYLRAIKPHSANLDARRVILQRMKEALLKGTWLFGVPRALNVFYALAKVISDEDSVDTKAVRAHVTNPLDLTARGLDYFENIYRKDVPTILEPMDRLFPDLRVLTVHLEYGLYLSETRILSAVETSMTTIAALLPMDVPTQVMWHMRGLIRNGGTEENILEALEISKSVVDASGGELKGGIPKISDILKEHLI